MKKRKSPNYWSFERIIKAAKESKLKSEFKKRFAGAYKAARKNGWLNKINLYLKSSGSLYERLIYVFEFPDKSVYVGLTYNSDRRYSDHILNENKNESTVFKYIEKSGLEPKYKLLTDYIDYELAVLQEERFLNKYKKDGWKILNRSKTGSLGSNIRKWTKEKCKEEALKYIYKKDFRKYSLSAHSAAFRNGWIEECCKHMIKLQKPNNYWTKEKCKEVALLCTSRSEFEKKYTSAYRAALRNNWMNVLFPKK